MKIGTALATYLMFTSVAFASQIQFNQDEAPVCYRGNAKTALTELLALDYDPVLKNGRIIKGSRDGARLLYAEQIDENGSVQLRLMLPPCR